MCSYWLCSRRVAFRACRVQVTLLHLPSWFRERERERLVITSLKRFFLMIFKKLKKFIAIFDDIIPIHLHLILQYHRTRLGTITVSL